MQESIAKEHLTNVIGDGLIAFVEFTDFECPFCAKHAQETFPRLKQELIDSGKARYITLNLPLFSHTNAIFAAEAAECAAEQEKYHEMRDLLFARQKELPTANYLMYAQELGLHVTDFEACLNNDRKLAKIEADRELAKRLGATGTPTIFIARVREDGGVDLLKRISGAYPADVILTRWQSCRVVRGG